MTIKQADKLIAQLQKKIAEYHNNKELDINIKKGLLAGLDDAIQIVRNKGN